MDSFKRNGNSKKTFFFIEENDFIEWRLKGLLNSKPNIVKVTSSSKENYGKKVFDVIFEKRHPDKEVNKVNVNLYKFQNGEKEKINNTHKELKDNDFIVYSFKEKIEKKTEKPDELIKVNLSDLSFYTVGASTKEIYLRHIDDFLEHNVKLDESRPIGKQLIYRKNSHHLNNALALLYTDEDIYLSSYIREYFSEISNASGYSCAVIVMENPNKIPSRRYWRTILDDYIYIIWQMSGWADSKPYDKSVMYDIANKLGVPITNMPCAVSFPERKIYSLSGKNNLEIKFREIFEELNKSNKPKESLLYRVKKEYEKSQSSPKEKLFISYSSSDKKIVEEVATLIRNKKIKLWFDEWDISLGDSIIDELENGLHGSSHLIVFISHNSVSSKWVKKEINSAILKKIDNNNMKIIPVKLDDCKTPLFLSEYSGINSNNSKEIAEKITSLLIKDQSHIDIESINI